MSCKNGVFFCCFVSVYGSKRDAFFVYCFWRNFPAFFSTKECCSRWLGFCFLFNHFMIIVIGHRLGLIFHSSTIWNRIAHTMDNLHFYRHFMKFRCMCLCHGFSPSFLFCLLLRQCCCCSLSAWSLLHVADSWPVNKYCCHLVSSVETLYYMRSVYEAQLPTPSQIVGKKIIAEKVITEFWFLWRE